MQGKIIRKAQCLNWNNTLALGGIKDKITSLFISIIQGAHFKLRTLKKKIKFTTNQPMTNQPITTSNKTNKNKYQHIKYGGEGDFISWHLWDEALAIENQFKKKSSPYLENLL